PRMWLGSEPSTRLSAMALALGCTKLTASFAPMPKLCQLMARFWLDWLTAIEVPARDTLPVPPTICSPVGSAHDGPATAAATAVLSTLSEWRLPRPRAHSGAGTQACCLSFQTWRNARFMAPPMSARLTARSDG